ncbi:MAG: radical SAM protein [Candidatus Aenigmatarchaeota archaeon]
MFENLELFLKKEFNFLPNKNQLRDIKRLIFEIMKRDKLTIEEILNYLKNIPQINKYCGRNKFFPIKDALISKRFPLTNQKEKIDTKKIFLSDLKKPLKNNYRPLNEFIPKKIFVEKEVKDSYLVENFKKKFPNIEIEFLDYYSDYLKKHKFSLIDLKKPFVFIVKERWDFIKLCPCTKHHLSCGYWIFNLGFGCPFDCSYCFLQHYSNFPGIILPTNLEDFFEKFDYFYKKLQAPIRIGTGEFLDSLALDEITQYSKKLIPYFKDKKLLFELKTKSNKISNLLEIEPSKNIIISWSLNPQIIIEKEEIATANLFERLKAAKKIQQKGYSIGLHFDPIVHFENWDFFYKQLIEKVYEILKPPFSWISLGTLRANRKLKTYVELRFPESEIFYGELFIGEDKKLRYPLFLRIEIYKNMIKWIREFDQKTPIYFCMENKEVWKLLNKSSSKEIEKELLGL